MAARAARLGPGGAYLVGGIVVHNKGCSLTDTPEVPKEVNWDETGLFCACC
jgi:AMMECR1 domain-containing protein